MIDLNKRLRGWLDCHKCRLHRFRRKVVLGRGVVPAEIMFVGEGPGRSEDLIGEAFIGRAGKLLDKAIAAATKLSKRKDPPTIYISNVVACIPLDEKGGKFREPQKDEELACFPRLMMTARLVDPDHIILLGKIAERACIEKFPEAKSLRHPAYLLRRGGTASTEYRTFVRELADIFKKKPERRLGPKDLFGDRV